MGAIRPTPDEEYKDQLGPEEIKDILKEEAEIKVFSYDEAVSDMAKRLIEQYYATRLKQNHGTVESK